MHKPGMVSIWFFIGMILLVYGIIITGAGIYDLFNPPPHPLVLANLHSGVWWGGFLLLVGLIYSIKFRPSKTK
ncbi:MAG TPA: hypothetical protein VMJ34_11730 [Bryobacteraceae bacterium]|nr:hypothetical protein [Bryobacteraceae bacterium]